MSWKVIRDAGHDVIFATPDGGEASADPRMLHGEGLDPWGFIPGLRKLKLIGLLLRARRPAREAYNELKRDPNFVNPVCYADLRAADFDGLLLPGGHAKGMRPYLESEVLQQFVVDFFQPTSNAGPHKPVGAVCHGVVLAARSISAETGRSVLYGRKTTALTWSQEQSAWRLTKYFARFWDSLYYRTYSESQAEPAGYWSVESEVKRSLESPEHFLHVPHDIPDARLKTDNLHRDTLEDSRPAWVVRDGNYVSARWPGDVHSFALTFLSVLIEDSSNTVDYAAAVNPRPRSETH